MIALPKTKTILLVAVVAVAILGLTTASIVLNNTAEASEDGRTPVRDNVDIENIKLKNGQFRVIVDNAGIGATSDVEITWVFNPEKCVLLAAGSDGTATIAVVPLVNDGALTVPNLPLPGPLPVGHNDVMWAEAIILGVNGDAKDCKIDSKKGEFVAVSTIGMGGPGLLLTSNPP